VSTFGASITEGRKREVIDSAREKRRVKVARPKKTKERQVPKFLMQEEVKIEVTVESTSLLPVPPRVKENKTNRVRRNKRTNKTLTPRRNNLDLHCISSLVSLNKT
jgi:hypothetical protein